MIPSPGINIPPPAAGAAGAAAPPKLKPFINTKDVLGVCVSIRLKKQVQWV